jgi:hypothetical protein
MKFDSSKQKLTLEELSKFEQDYNLKLPESYRNIMLEYNGGYPEKTYFQGGIVYFDPIKYGNTTLEKMIDGMQGFLPKGAFPFADYSGQSLCISLNKTDYGAIYFLDETGEYDKVCDSFEQFLEELSDEEDY